MNLELCLVLFDGVQGDLAFFGYATIRSSQAEPVEASLPSHALPLREKKLLPNILIPQFRFVLNELLHKPLAFLVIHNNHLHSVAF